ncbi:cyclic-phosphate processing receiver domain-containing protein [Paenibacillus sp. MBLB4367]|uniref:cyclic-phosphate processing receiver domain-containing protein n=1 Tax=Paenibacillus sp. MBLB4367 TaxID=3384767 RepID=UPI0039080B02
MINVYLDDLRPRPKGYKLARTVKQCLKLIKRNKVNVLSLDYDLGFGRPTGFEIVQYVMKSKRYPKKIILHTANPFGRIRMYHALKLNKPRNVALVVRPEPISLF